MAALALNIERHRRRTGSPTDMRLLYSVRTPEDAVFCAEAGAVKASVFVCAFAFASGSPHPFAQHEPILLRRPRSARLRPRRS